MFLREFKPREALEDAIAQKLGFPSLTAYPHVIRNDKGWRDNEIRIEYSWVVILQASFIGEGGLFSVKLARTQYREIVNEEKLIKGIFIIGKNGNLSQIFTEEVKTRFYDPIRAFNSMDLFSAQKGIVLDGHFYEFHIMGEGIEAFVAFGTPGEEAWKEWERAVRVLGLELAAKARNEEMVRLFTY